MKQAPKLRTEMDSLGKVQVPDQAYFGAFTKRAMTNFKISGQFAPGIFIKALGITKHAAAIANNKLNALNKKHTKALFQACTEFTDGKFDQEFVVDIFQAGAGTSYNMNANEIIANRANEILQGKLGAYEYLHPNDHVNMGQSTNDVIPTATRVAILLSEKDLSTRLTSLLERLDGLSKKYKSLLKVGRTHLQDAVPITVGQEIDSYSEALKKSHKNFLDQLSKLKVIGLGGTAVGTGINSDPLYQKNVTKALSDLSGVSFKAAKNNTEIANNMTPFLDVANAVSSLAICLGNLSSNLNLMASGPLGGFNEVILPAVQPGSSIMPGKINPSILECTDMITMQVLGNTKVIELACQKSHFQLNVYCPIIMANLLNSIAILTNGITMFSDYCLKDILINEEQIKKTYNQSLVTGTALAPYLGYNQTAAIIKSALKSGRTIKDEVLEQNLMSSSALNQVLAVNRVSRPSKKLNLKIN